MTDTSKSLERSGRRGRRRLSPVQKYEAFVQVLTGEMTVVECADHWGVDRSTIMRAREVAKKGALDALASSRPGTRAGGVDPELVMARDEAARLGEALKEMAVKVTLLAGKRALGVTAGVPPRVEAGTKAALLDLVDGAVGEGWSTARACSVLELDSRRCRRWQHRRGAGRLEDQHCGRHRAACHHPNRAPGDRGAVRALGRHRRRLPQARAPRLLREPGVGVTVDAVSRSSSPGAGSVRPPPAHTGAGAAPAGLDRMEAPPDLDLRHNPLPQSRPGRLRHPRRRHPQMARHPRHRRGDRHPSRGRLHTSPRHRRDCGPPSRPAKPTAPAEATTATRSPSCWPCQTTDPRCEPAPPESSSPCAPSRPASAGPAPRLTKHGSRPCSATSKPSGPTSRRSPTPTRCEPSSTTPDTTTTPAACTPPSATSPPTTNTKDEQSTIRQARRDGLNRARLTRIAYHRNNNQNQP